MKIARLMQAAGHRPSALSLREGAVIFTFRSPAKTPGKTPGKRQGNARENPERAIHRAIRILRDSGLLMRVGPDKGGQWKVIE